MNYKTIGTRDADDKKAVAYRACMNSECHKTTFSAQAIRMAMALEMAMKECYNAAGVFVSYRKKFIAVKIHDILGVVNQSGLDYLEAGYVIAGIEKVKTGQGIIYRIPVTI